MARTFTISGRVKRLGFCTERRKGRIQVSNGREMAFRQRKDVRIRCVVSQGRFGYQEWWLLCYRLGLIGLALSYGELFLLQILDCSSSLTQPPVRYQT